MDIVIVGFEGCAPCEESKQAFDDAGIAYTFFEAGTQEGSPYNKLAAVDGEYGLPQFFLDGEFMGAGMGIAYMFVKRYGTNLRD